MQQYGCSCVTIFFKQQYPQTAAHVNWSLAFNLKVLFFFFFFFFLNQKRVSELWKSDNDVTILKTSDANLSKLDNNKIIMNMNLSHLMPPQQRYLVWSTNIDQKQWVKSTLTSALYQPKSSQIIKKYTHTMPYIIWQKVTSFMKLCKSCIHTQFDLDTTNYVT